MIKVNLQLYGQGSSCQSLQTQQNDGWHAIIPTIFQNLLAERKNKKRSWLSGLPDASLQQSVVGFWVSVVNESLCAYGVLREVSELSTDIGEQHKGGAWCKDDWLWRSSCHPKIASVGAVGESALTKGKWNSHGFAFCGERNVIEKKKSYLGSGMGWWIWMRWNWCSAGAGVTNSC